MKVCLRLSIIIYNELSGMINIYLSVTEISERDENMIVGGWWWCRHVTLSTLQSLPHSSHSHGSSDLPREITARESFSAEQLHQH